MSIVKRKIKRHDLWPPLELTLTDNGTPVDLTNAATATLYMKKGTTLKIPAGSMIIDPDQTLAGHRGWVSYDWVLGDTDTAADYDAEVEVLWQNGKIQTFPEGSYFVISVVADLGP